ncbi:hypothetical protein SISNIDRAFT_463041 [Sistotremastrum niveocremeum HHB9708]|uniref:Extracellular membrane protein CFEM domain-containing protein n=1 Tax=Sistotremastrum niveocremeum HHB9708 TaxID=1314777 RepID=A0A164YNB4_9AGAM|nr:hypothetical protein SISNIDRAFT_463041 [Sistotremastrum niveocremeum HHB9708]
MQPSFGFLSSILALSVLVAAMPAPANTSSQNCRTQHEACLSKGLTQAQCNAHLSQCQHDASGNLLEKRRGRGRGGRGRGGGGGKKSKTSKTKTKTKSKTQQGTPTSSIDVPGTIETVASVASVIVNTFPTPTPDFNNSGGSESGDGDSDSDSDGGDSDSPPPPSPTGATTVTASEPEGTTTAQNGGDDGGSESTDTPTTDGDAEPTATGAGSQGPPTGIPISLQAFLSNPLLGVGRSQHISPYLTQSAIT